MEPLALVAVPGFAGGLVFALWLLRSNRKPGRRMKLDLTGADLPPTDIINMAHIKVAGVGGLGLVVMAIGVAVDIPRIGLSVGAGLVLGTLLAGLLILGRRRTGPMPSSGQRPGANTMLSLDDPERPPDEPGDAGRSVRRSDLDAVPSESTARA